MDEQRFDQLSRRLAGFRTRRQALKAAAGAVAGVVAGTRVAAAQDCTAQYSPCSSDDQCCDGAVCQWGMCMPGCRVDGVFANAWTSPAGDTCNQCLPDVSTTSWTPVNEGMSCWSGDPNAGVTTCQSGVCAGNAPASCPPSTPCQLEGSVDPVSGQCVYPPAPAGTLCGGGAMCHGDFYQPADMCDGNGYCVGGGTQTVTCAPYACGDDACLASCSADSDCVQSAHCDDGQCLPDLGLGAPCDEDSDCVSGVCDQRNGVCCNQVCDGLCEVCSAETGGFCSPKTCEDGLSCTTGTCDPNTGECSQTVNNGACLSEGVCYDTSSSPDHCGACDQSCEAWTGSSNATCEGSGQCCAATSAGKICCTYGSTKPSVCSEPCTIDCNCRDVAYDCGPFGTLTCYEEVCDQCPSTCDTPCCV